MTSFGGITSRNNCSNMALSTYKVEVWGYWRSELHTSPYFVTELFKTLVIVFNNVLMLTDIMEQLLFKHIEHKIKSKFLYIGLLPYFFSSAKGAKSVLPHPVALHVFISSFFFLDGRLNTLLGNYELSETRMKNWWSVQYEDRADRAALGILPERALLLWPKYCTDADLNRYRNLW